MPRKKTVIYIVIVIILLFVFSNEYRTVWSPQLSELRIDGNTQFLSNEYFDELDQLYEKVRLDHEKWYIVDGAKSAAAEAVIDKMMKDLGENLTELLNHENNVLFFETFDKNVRRLDKITEAIHYFRNILNEYSGAPDNLDDMIALASKGEWKLFSAKFHRYSYEGINAALNVKFISADGRFEVVYNTETGEIVTDPYNMGTYNYAPGSLHPQKYYRHYLYDITPWKKWGNAEGVSYEDIMKLESKHGSAVEKKNSKEIKKRIQQAIELRFSEALAPPFRTNIKQTVYSQTTPLH